MNSFMQQALGLAAQGKGLTSPNPTVGAVVEKNGQVLGQGFHRWTGKDHAEIVALRGAGAAALGSTRYVTLEPGSQVGRTQPWPEAVSAAGVERVVAAMQD